jgi:hypothetical protein
VIGIAILTITSVYLENLNILITTWAYPTLLISIIISITTFWMIYKQGNSSLKLLLKDVMQYRLFIFGFIATIVLLTLPMMKDGVNFFFLRGSGADQTNYICMTQYIISGGNLHNSWLNFLGKFLVLNDRPALSILLALSSIITNIDVHAIVYNFLLVFLVVLFGVSYFFVYRLLNNNWYALIVGLAVTLGFWSQYVLDVESMSFLSSIPLVVGFISLVLHIDQNPQSLQLTKRIFLSVIFVSISFLYLEIVPSLLLCCLIYILLKYYRGILNNKELRFYLITVLIALILLLPDIKPLYYFMKAQVLFVFIRNNWWIEWLPWLYYKPIIGFWGMSYLSSIVNFKYLEAVISTLALIFSLIFFSIISYILLNKKKLTENIYLIITAMIVAVFIEFTCLVLTKSWWAAGKALTYAFPFFYFIMTYVFLLAREYKSILFISVKYLVLLWFFIQISLGFYRIAAASTHTFYPNYMRNDQEKGVVDGDIRAILTYISKHKIQSLAVLISGNCYQSQIVQLALHKIITYDLDGDYGSSSFLLINGFVPAPQYLLTDNDSGFFKFNRSECLASNHALCLLKISDDIKHKLSNNQWITVTSVISQNSVNKQYGF